MKPEDAQAVETLQANWRAERETALVYRDLAADEPDEKRRGILLRMAEAEERHAVRIAAKKLRYAAEFFASLFPRKRSRTYLKTLAGLQDVLGQFNDGTIALRLASSVERPGRDAAVGIVHGWIAGQASAREPKLARVQRRFEKARHFWT